MSLQTNVILPYSGWWLPPGAFKYHFQYNQFTFCRRFTFNPRWFLVPASFVQEGDTGVYVPKTKHWVRERLPRRRPQQQFLCLECLANVGRYINSGLLPEWTWTGGLYIGSGG